MAVAADDRLSSLVAIDGKHTCQSESRTLREAA